MVLLYRKKFLFTGDHLAWSPNRQTLIGFRSACWYSWTEQIKSMEKLLDYEFEWVLPVTGAFIMTAPKACIGIFKMYRVDERKRRRRVLGCQVSVSGLSGKDES
jgi:hypothetical protein